MQFWCFFFRSWKMMLIFFGTKNIFFFYSILKRSCLKRCVKKNPEISFFFKIVWKHFYKMLYIYIYIYSDRSQGLFAPIYFSSEIDDCKRFSEKRIRYLILFFGKGQFNSQKNIFLKLYDKSVCCYPSYGEKCYRKNKKGQFKPLYYIWNSLYIFLLNSNISTWTFWSIEIFLNNFEKKIQLSAGFPGFFGFRVLGAFYLKKKL